MGGRGGGGGGGKGAGGGGAASPATPTAPAAFDAVKVATSLQSDIDEFTVSSSGKRAAERQAAGEAGIRQKLDGLNVGQLRQVAGQYRMITMARGKPPAAGSSAGEWVNWMVGQWRQSRGQWSLQ